MFVKIKLKLTYNIRNLLPPEIVVIFVSLLKRQIHKTDVIFSLFPFNSIAFYFAAEVSEEHLNRTSMYSSQIAGISTERCWYSYVPEERRRCAVLTSAELMPSPQSYRWEVITSKITEE
jgi:hypothetical protein